MDKFLEKCLDFFAKTFNEAWICIVVGLCGILITFVVALVIGLFCGEFNKNKRGCALVAKGFDEKGMKKLEKYAANPATFSIETVILHPYAYSFIKRLKSVVFIATAAFAIISCSLLSFSQTALASFGSFAAYSSEHFSALAAILCFGLGFVLYVLSLVLAALSLKAGIKKFAAAENPAPPVEKKASAKKRKSNEAEREDEPEQEEVPQIIPAKKERDKEDEMQISHTAQEIIDRIKDLALEGGADLETVKGLFRQLESEKSHPLNQNPYATRQINKAAAIVNMMLDTL